MLPLYLKDLIVSYLPTEHFALRLQAYLWFLEFSKVEWEAEPSVIRPPYCETGCQFEFEVGPQSSFKFRLKNFLYLLRWSCAISYLCYCWPWLWGELPGVFQFICASGLSSCPQPESGSVWGLLLFVLFSGSVKREFSLLSVSYQPMHAHDRGMIPTEDLIRSVGYLS